jgi:hypothetical protein
VRNIVQKAVKDLSLEQTIKTYEEIWLSKLFVLKPYRMLRPDTETKLNEDEFPNVRFSVHQVLIEE